MPELFEELEVEDPDELPAEPADWDADDPFEPVALDFAVPAAPLPDVEPCDVLPAGDLAGLVTVGWVEPGSATATTPATATLAKPTVAVVAFKWRLPRSRSATASET